MTKGTTIDELFRQTVAEHGDLPAILRKEKQAYVPVTYRELDRKVDAFARGLSSVGIAKGDRVAILSENRMEWAVTDLALARLGAVNVGIFPTLPANQVEYIVADSSAQAIVVSDPEQLGKALAVREKIPGLLTIAMEGNGALPKGVVGFDELLRRGEATEGDESVSPVKPEDWANLIYTSGTMGDPKGVILTNDNIVSNVRAGREVLPFGPGDVLLSFVPLNHVMGRMADHYLPLSGGSTIAYVENLRKLRQNILEVRPHYMVLVPRVFEMFREALIAAAEKEKPLRRRLFFWALAAGTRAVEAVQHGAACPAGLRLRWWLADRLVFSAIRARLGLDRLRLFLSGGAPLSSRIAEFFAALGLPILEGYGLSETSPLVTVNPPEKLRFGTVGLPVPGVEIRNVSDGLADYEKVRRFVLLDHDFRIEDGELTPTLKVRRKVVLEKYREVIEGMYGAGEG